MKSAADHVAEVTLELGGKSPNIIFPDADIDAAVNGVMAGIFAATGQTCIAGSRLLIHESVRDDILDRLARRAPEIKMGDPLDMETEMGPIAFAEQLDKVRYYVDLGVSEGERWSAVGSVRPTPSWPTGTSSSRPSSAVSTTRCGWRGRRSRPRAVGHHLHLRGGGTAARKRHHLRAGGGGVDQRHPARAPGRAPPQRRHHLDQLLPHARQQCALRRLGRAASGGRTAWKASTPICKPNRSGSNSPATAATRSNSADPKEPS